MNFTQSKQWLERAYKVIPSATQTFSKGPTQWVRGVSPHFLERGEGAWVWDVDGNRYLDYLMALGPIILGYNHPRIQQAVCDQMRAGSTFSMMHRLEVELAERLVEIIPGAEMVRFGKNGSDANTAAIRAARAYTGRDRVACCGYHGWHDWFIGSTTRDKGVPKAVAELTHVFQYNDLKSLERLLIQYPGEFAAVIMEPVGVEPPQAGYLEGVRELCRSHGVLLIFDEIVTGFRLSLGGAQAFFGVTPDLATFGKAMANGLPLSAVVGPREIMEIFDEIFYSGTFGGETVSLAAGLATIDELQTHNILSQNWKHGEAVHAILKDLIKQYQLEDVVKLMGYPVRSVLAFPDVDEKRTRLKRSYFMQECVKRGLLYFCSHIPCGAHGEKELEFTETVFRQVVPLFASAHRDDLFEQKLEGGCVEAIFRKA
ncbi:3-aminobutyryl-CoA aminotransferase [Candidatus Magnetaquicoccaceae bacterium FCR-1]|uniref:3-aminobutyryl-CoA aminotransferase n=1 Tax=Candidatus Magnetaquiglobus chichijimensis TaxID=3141448 RepID=A0ABQ0C655_9PROT